MSRIIANIVGRNEADKYLVPVLDRLVGQVDEIVFTDDASTDNTVEIVERYTEKIQKLSEPLFSTHEGQLRQKSWDFLIEKTSPTEKDWVLAIDCDELLYETKVPMRSLIETPGVNIINISFFHMWNETHFRIDKAWRPHGSSRLFRFPPNSKFKDVALAPGSEPEAVRFTLQHFPRTFIQDSGLYMKHLSYIKDEDKKAKYDRYMQIDGGKFHSNAHIVSIMDENPQLQEWIWE